MVTLEVRWRREDGAWEHRSVELKRGPHSRLLQVEMTSESGECLGAMFKPEEARELAAHLWSVADAIDAGLQSSPSSHNRA